MKAIILAVALAASTQAHAAAARGYTTIDIATQKVAQAVVQNDLKFVTAATTNICGNTNQEGTDVKVQIEAEGRYITIRHYGVTYAGIFTREKAIECAN